MLVKLWMAFCDFHMGKYRSALDEYQRLQGLENSGLDLHEISLNVAICMFYLGTFMPCIGRSLGIQFF